MTDADFLRAICDEPENMTPRLMYADWLIEQGHPRGEFIREQIENPMPENPDIQLAHKLKAWTYFSTGLWKWRDPPAVLAEAGRFTGPDTVLFFGGIGMAEDYEEKIVYRRGFVERVHRTCDWWMKHGREMVKIAPVLKVYPTDREPWNNWSYTLNEEKQWGWERSPTWRFCIEGYYISPEAWYLMEGEISKVDVRCYATKEDAVEDLSYGLLKWARS